MLTRVVSEPFDILCADFVGPLPRSKQGNSSLLFFHNVFSKWVELVPLRKATTAVVKKAFRERILGRVGIARKLVCDNGTQFTSRALKLYFTKLGEGVQYTAPYCPQENPTESINRTVKTLISQLSEDGESSCRRFPSLSIVAYWYACLRCCTTNLPLDRRSYIQVLKARRRISKESSTSYDRIFNVHL